MALQAQSDFQQKEIATLRLELDADVREQLELKDKEIASLRESLAADRPRPKVGHHRRCASTYSEKSWSDALNSDTWSEVDQDDIESDMALLGIVDSPNASPNVNCPQLVRECHRGVASAGEACDNADDSTEIEERMEVPREVPELLKLQPN
jgi:hypothetical protein